MDITAQILEVRQGRITCLKADGRLFVEKQTEEQKPAKPTPIKQKRQYHKRKNHKNRPDGSIYSETYGAVIRKEEIDAVKRALSKVEVGYIPNSKTIAQETGFNMQRVNAILDAMRKHNIIERKDHEGSLIYRVC